MEATYTRAKVPNSFSRRMKLLCNTLTEHDKLKEGKKNRESRVQTSYMKNLYKRVFCNNAKSLVK